MGSNKRNASRSSNGFVLSQRLALLAAMTAAGCSDNVTGPSGSGGRTGNGGSAMGGTSAGTLSGGTTGSGGSQGTGGAAGSGGIAGMGGATATGGAMGTGGTQSTGGATGTGGSSLGTGGTQATGGRQAGGTTSAGGTTGAGGTVGSGGSQPDAGGMGGAAGTGGTSGTFSPCTAGTACKIMPLGDSITEGYGSSGADGGGPANQGGYRIELFRQTVKNGKSATFVGNQTNGPTTVENKPFPQKHEGHGGWTISQIAGIADGTLSTNKPNIVLLKIGTNDINGGGSTAAPDGLKNLIDQITKDVPSALLVVSSIIPIKDDNTNQRVKTYNATIPTTVSAAAAAGKHVVFVDNYAALSADSSWKTKYMYDNLHPNDAGYALLGQTWYAAISAVLPATP